jgi:hypothetical protein
LTSLAAAYLTSCGYILRACWLLLLLVLVAL